MIGPNDLLHPSPAPHFKIFQTHYRDRKICRGVAIASYFLNVRFNSPLPKLKILTTEIMYPLMKPVSSLLFAAHSEFRENLQLLLLYVSMCLKFPLPYNHIKLASVENWSRKHSKINNQETELQPLNFGWFSLVDTKPADAGLLSTALLRSPFLYTGDTFLYV